MPGIRHLPPPRKVRMPWHICQVGHAAHMHHAVRLVVPPPAAAAAAVAAMTEPRLAAATPVHAG